jgi:CDP-diacylglycerol---glycerol-3-phosphate 3-phosphatidyltransferase
MNVPNALTVLRILLVPVLVVALLADTSRGDLLAAGLFALASITDWFDGHLARTRGQITTFGKLMDPVADKLLVIAALVSLVSLDRLPAWVAMVIIVRELIVTVARAAATQQGVVAASLQLGKLKTSIQVLAIFLLIAYDPSPWWVDAVVYATVALTLVSGAQVLLGLRRELQVAR